MQAEEVGGEEALVHVSAVDRGCREAVRYTCRTRATSDVSSTGRLRVDGLTS